VGADSGANTGIACAIHFNACFNLQQPPSIPFLKHTTVIRPVAFAGHRRTFDQEMPGPTLYHRATGGPVTYPGDRPAVKRIRSAAAFDLVYPMQRTVVLVAYKYSRIHRASPSDGAVRDSRSMSSGQ
jgi:hypothetical protein